ncbi:MAG: hypothetical protein BHV69_10175 [Bacteroidales bacterium 52_46]|nr:MAG: hypothetical protein BHV69_10175 [Bacteroidales bacterium 52_46]
MAVYASITDTIRGYNAAYFALGYKNTANGSQAVNLTAIQYVERHKVKPLISNIQIKFSSEKYFQKFSLINFTSQI